MVVLDHVKKIARKLLHFVRRDASESDPNVGSDLPSLLTDPLEALCFRQGGKKIAFECPLDRTVKLNGLSYSSVGYHPFVATLQEYAAGENTCYEDSVLKRYYATHQPAHAAEAIVGFGQAPRAYADYGAHLYRLTPWSSWSVEEMDQHVREWSREDAEEHGGTDQDWSLEIDGFQYHGPVSDRRGQLEYQRLVDVYESVRISGYNRSHGHAHFLMLRRGEDIRFLNIGEGNHRTAAMVALGYEKIPAVFGRSHIVDAGMANYWPQVRRGDWTQKQAEAYINHLFDFDSRAWARKHDLLCEQRIPANPLNSGRGDR